MKQAHQTISAICLSFLLLCSAPVVLAQEGSDLYLAELNLWHKQPITNLVRLTDTDGYTNQPYFFDRNHLYFTQSVTQADKSQMDIFLYQFSDKASANITQSTESEYSPTPLPYAAGMSVIRVNDEGKQELWALDQQGKPLQHLAPAIEPVGYHVWLNKEELLVFVLGEPHTLQRVVIKAEEKQGKIIDSDIGASLYRFERSDWFLYSRGANEPMLKAYNATTEQTIEIAKLPEGVNYFSVSSTGHVFTSDGKALYHRQLILKGDKLRAEGEWEPIKIANKSCQSGISRTAISHFSDKIVLVCPRE